MKRRAKGRILPGEVAVQPLFGLREERRFAGVCAGWEPGGKEGLTLEPDAEYALRVRCQQDRPKG